jgi:DNA modification methylase
MREDKNDFTHGEDVQVLIGDCIESMRSLPDNSVHMCVTSPPYWGQRDYGNDGQIGLEKDPEEFIEKLVNVFREVRRVLRDDGTLWLNLGDTYASGKSRYSHREHSMLGGTRNDGKLGALQDGKRACVKNHEYLKDKDLIGIPWRVALALQRDGWWLRQDIIWAKPNCMPESVKDRCTKNHEYVFLLTKSASYFYDNEAIKVKIKGEEHSKKNKRSVWTVSPKAFRGSHFAVYPPELIEPCILAGTSAGGCCSKCGSPYDRITEMKDIGVTNAMKRAGGNREGKYEGEDLKDYKTGNMTDSTPRTVKQRTLDAMSKVKVTIGWQPMCECDTDSIPCTVLDPFGGSGTTAAVALKHHRKSIMCELNPEYASLMPKRIKEITGMASGQKRLFGGDWGF